MPYRYLEHVGDAAIEARGRTREDAFAEAARAMFGLMVPGGGAAAETRAEVEVRAPDLGGLLVEFLNELLSRQGVMGVIFTECRVKEIAREGGGYRLAAEAVGAGPGSLRGLLGAEVKAASYSGLMVDEEGDSTTVRCVLDM